DPFHTTLPSAFTINSYSSLLRFSTSASRVCSLPSFADGNFSGLSWKVGLMFTYPFAPHSACVDLPGFRLTETATRSFSSSFHITYRRLQVFLARSFNPIWRAT